jgi:hypothetical protein
MPPANSQNSPLPPEINVLPIRITGIIADEVTMPAMNGRAGSALYDIPFRLSRRPSSTWSDLFMQVWDHPPRWTSMHRPGIASVEGDKIWLRGTSLHEVEHYHRDTLKLAVGEANRLFEKAMQSHEAQQRAEAERTRLHRESVQDAASSIDFD